VNSCLYEGSVRHRRYGTPSDELHYRMFMVCLDLDELPGCLDGHPLWSARRPALAWFRRADYLGDPRTPLAQSVRELVAERTGETPEGPIRLLTHLRYFGHCFNPVSFYYCYDGDGQRVKAVVAHVTNTPWGERHAYVMPAEHTADHGTVKLMGGQFAKALHVSPLMGMEHTYDWHLTEPGKRLAVHIASQKTDGETVFDATLALERRELSNYELSRALARYPFLTMRIIARIYGHALHLRRRGASYFPHPHSAPSAGSTTLDHTKHEAAASA
jgi:DUF1365 family protein